MKEIITCIKCKREPKEGEGFIILERLKAYICAECFERELTAVY